MDSNSLPLNNLNPAQRKAFNEHLNDLWDDYQDELADLIIEAKTMVPNSLYFGDDPTTEARRQLEDYARKANLIAQDYYRNVRAAWAEAAGIGMPDYTEAQVSSDRAFWQIVGGYNNTMHVGAKFTDVINGRSKAGLTMDYLWAVNTQGYTEDDWARLAKDIINETARLTGRLTAQNDPTKPKYARVPQGKTCAFCAMLASRGFVYASEDTAGKWHKYHHDCDCKIVPSWGETEIDGYDPDKLKAIYQQAKDAAKAAGAGSDLNTVLSWMRSESPESFTDGSNSRQTCASREAADSNNNSAKRIPAASTGCSAKPSTKTRRGSGPNTPPNTTSKKHGCPKVLTSAPPTAASTSTLTPSWPETAHTAQCRTSSTKAATCSTGYSTATCTPAVRTTEPCSPTRSTRTRKTSTTARKRCSWPTANHPTANTYSGTRPASTSRHRQNRPQHRRHAPSRARRRLPQNRRTPQRILPTTRKPPIIGGIRRNARRPARQPRRMGHHRELHAGIS
ncbi:MAG: hypothetical protein ACLS6O_00390 [Bifidobacterium sp.]